jgi:hypothetical protein
VAVRYTWEVDGERFTSDRLSHTPASSPDYEATQSHADPYPAGNVEQTRQRTFPWEGAVLALMVGGFPLILLNGVTSGRSFLPGMICLAAASLMLLWLAGRNG